MDRCSRRPDSPPQGRGAERRRAVARRTLSVHRRRPRARRLWAWLTRRGGSRPDPSNDASAAAEPGTVGAHSRQATWTAHKEQPPSVHHSVGGCSASGDRCGAAMIDAMAIPQPVDPTTVPTRCGRVRSRPRGTRRGRPAGPGPGPARSARRLPPQRTQPAVAAARQLHAPPRRRRDAARPLDQQRRLGPLRNRIVWTPQLRLETMRSDSVVRSMPTTSAPARSPGELLKSGCPPAPRQLVPAVGARRHGATHPPDHDYRRISTSSTQPLARPTSSDRTTPACIQ